MTFADFAITEVRFRKHFRVAPRDTWNESMLPLAEFLELPEDEREGRFPYVWTVDREQQLSRLLVDSTMVESCEDRQDFWTLLRSMAGVGEKPISREEIEQEVRRDVVGRLAQGLMQLASGEGGSVAALAESAAAPAAPAPDAAKTEAAGDYMAPWIDTEECTACDECTNLNPDIFVYDDRGKAIIRNPDGGPYKDLVRAAERCTAQVIHPGTPRDRSEKDIEKWIARGAKYN